MKVLKFGGTSIGSPERMQGLYSIIKSQPASKHLIVLSAVSGSTNALEDIAQKYVQQKTAAAHNQIEKLYETYVDYVKNLFQTASGVASGLEVVSKHFKLLYELGADLFTDREVRLVLAQGELLSTALLHCYLEEQQISSKLLNTLDFMKLNEVQEPDYDFITDRLKAILEAHESTKLFIMQGYICRNQLGEVDNLRRGGSDYTASIIGGVLQAAEIQIWTDIDGFHNNDPRYVLNTRPIAKLSFDEAAELAYFGAKILHPQSVYPAQKYNVPVRLLDTLDQEAKGTLISKVTQSTGRIVAIAAKDGITALRIQSSRMLMAYGFLRRVFEIFERFKVPIDMITTSEVAVSLTIDDVQHLQKIVEELAHFGEVHVDYNQSIICIVGDFKTNIHGHATIVSEAVKHIPVRMISYGGSDHNISMLVPQDYKIEALRSLHNRIF